MRNLQISLKIKWFEMTKSGIKTEEYREINEYWFKRLMFFDLEYESDFYTNADIGQAVSELANGCLSVIEELNLVFKKFNTNIMTLGYPKSTDTDRILKLEHKGIEIRTGNPAWGAEPDKLYFVILHGAIL